MRKKTLSFLLALMLLCSISVFASADPSPGSVTYTANGDMSETNFDVDQVFDNLEPGDTRSYTVTIHNANSKTTRWYMSNSVIESLEQNDKGDLIGGIQGGAYKYKLTYKGPGSTAKTLYDSDQKDSHNKFVGGENDSTVGDVPVGLNEATSNLKDFFFLDTLNRNESGTVTLTVSLEGETQDNTYQNTQARIKMNFAVEPVNSRTAVKTGDDNNLLPYYIGMTAAGLLFLYLALDAVTDRLYKKRKG